MTASQPIVLQAVVSAAEQAAVRQAAEQLAASLTKVAGATYAVECAFPSTLDAVDRSVRPAILLTSLVGEVDTPGEAWPATEQRLRATYKTLCDDGRLMVFISTVLRQVPTDGPSDAAMARRIRIRRLNLLAPELSRETGCFVVDVDRTLADIGAAPLKTDFRLGGPFAAAAAGKSIAMTLLSAGLDDAVPIDVQERARGLIAAYRPPSEATTFGRAMQPLGVHIVAERTGRRAQIVQPVRYLVDDDQVDLQVRRLMSGQIGPGAALGMLLRSVGHHGVRSTAKRTASGIGRYLRGRVLVWRPGRG
jgi:hypothetical protein